MALGAIIARVSLDDSEFRKGLNRLQQQAQRFQDLGDRLTVGLTAPLVAFGAVVANSFGEFDSLRRGLDAVTGSSAATAERLKELREIAKNPGIGFQEAIKGDIRLQAVGISADKSAKILKEFANAIALTGGGAKELNSVTVQLGQLSAKGKVLAQDLKPIIEAAPAVGQALKNMFGTVDSESIQKALEGAGKNSQDFINDLLVQLEKTPRVTGGFKNAIENIKDSIFVFSASVGDSANKIFQLDKRLQNLADNIGEYAGKFQELSEGQQKAILGTGVFTAALGPLLSILGRMPGLIKSVVGGKDVLFKAFSSLGNLLSGGQVGGGFLAFLRGSLSRIPQVAVAVGALTLVFRNLGAISSTITDFVQYFKDLYKESALVRGAIDAVVVTVKALAAAFDVFFQFSLGFIENIFGNIKTLFGTFGAVIKAVLTGNFNEIPQLISDALQKARERWFKWFDDIWDYGKKTFNSFFKEVSTPILPGAVGGGRDPQRFAQLNEKNKPKVNNVNIDSKKPDELQQALAKLNEELRKSTVLQKAYGDSYDGVNAKISAYQNFIESIAGKTLPGVNAAINKALQEIAKLQPAVQVINPLGQLQVDAQALFTDLIRLDKIKTLTGVAESMQELKSPITEIREEFENIDRIAEGMTGFDAVAAKIQVLSRAFEQGLISQSVYKNGIKELDTIAYRAQQGLRSVAEGFANFSFNLAAPSEVRAAVAGLTQEIEKQREVLLDSSATEAQKAAAAAQIELIRKQIQAEKDKGNIVKQVSLSIVRSIKDSIQAYIAQAIAGLIAKEASTKGIIGLALAGIGAGIVFSLFDTLVPKLASGGLAFGPTLALVGDNKNAKNDPEVIAPLSKLKQMLNDGGFGGGKVQIFGTLQGNDIRVSNQYATAYYSRLN